MKVDGLLKETIKEETKVGVEFNYLEMIVFVMNPLMSRHKLAIKKGHIMRRLGHAIQESPQPKPWTPPNQVNPQRTDGVFGFDSKYGNDIVGLLAQLVRAHP